MSYLKVTKTSEVKEGKGSLFRLKNRTFAIYKINGKFMAIDDICNHKGFSLCSGTLMEGGIVSCSGHGWRYKISSGENLTLPGLDLEVYKLKIEGEDILIDIID